MDPNLFKARLTELIDAISITSFDFIRRGLLEKHKLLVAVHLCFKILKQKYVLAGNSTAGGGVNPSELQDYLIMPQPQESKSFKEFVITDPFATKQNIEENRWMDIKMFESVLLIKDGITQFKKPNIIDQMDQANPDPKANPGTPGPWQEWFDLEDPEAHNLPAPYDKPEKCSAFSKLCLLRAMRPDRIPPALTNFVASNLGDDYTVQPPFDIAQCYRESTHKTPFFFVLFPGVDPTVEVEALGRGEGGCVDSTGEVLDYCVSNGKFNNISMGQGQEDYGLKSLNEAAKNGTWVFLQNVHLMQSWLKQLERALELVSEDPTTHKDFRCFISGEPPPLPMMRNVPEAILQQSQKIANESPSSVKPNWNGALALFNQQNFDNCVHKKDFSAMLMSLCFFHAIVGCRRGFGSLGWSRAYPFNKGDLTNCADLLLKYLNNSKTRQKKVTRPGEDPKMITLPIVPWDDLRYLFGEIMYGGHITDDWDRRTNSVYLEEFMDKPLVCHDNEPDGPEIFPGLKLPTPKKMTFKEAPDDDDPENPRTDDPEFAQYVQWLAQANVPETPRTYGMHPNAAIATNINTGNMIFSTIMDLSGGGGGGGGDDSGPSKEDVVDEVITKFLELCPEDYNIPALKIYIKQNLNDVKTPYTVVSLQEMERMNVLLQTIRNSLIELRLGMEGALNMSELMETLMDCLFTNRVGPVWVKFSYPSKKPLQPWYKDMVARNKQLKTWSENFDLPKSLWLPGLFNPMSFLTACMQTTARATGMALDQMALETHPSKIFNEKEIEAYPKTKFKGEEIAHGVYVHGLYMECARWDDTNQCVAESKLKELYPLMPVIHVISVNVLEKIHENIYRCPMYVTTARGGTYVTEATMKHEEPSAAVPRPSNKWVMAGVCIILSLDN